MNGQQITKIVDYYRINHGFHSPYTFILDGNFLKILVERDMNLEERLKPIIVGKTRPKLQILGRDFAIIHQQAKQLPLLKCPHPFTSADLCIIEHVKQLKNVIVCSQDTILRRKLRGRQVGLMYFGPDQRITMEDVERHQLRDAKEREREKFLPKGKELRELEEYKKQEEVREKIRRRNQQYKLAASRGVELKYVKKKVLKGPHPLSAKKKKPKSSSKTSSRPQNNQPEPQNTSSQVAPPQQNVDNPQKKKRIRKRNKNKNKSNPQQQISQQ